MNDKAFLSALMILLAGIWVMSLVWSRPIPVVASTNIEGLPRQIDHFQGVDDHFGPGVYAELGADVYLYRHYRGDARQIDLYIGYYGTARGGRSTHNPGACLPGAGWGIVEEQKVNLSGVGESPELVNLVVAERDGLFLTLLHWYQVNGSEIAVNGFKQNLLRLKNRILFNRDDGAFVQVSIITGREDLPEAKQQGERFSRRIQRFLPQYWPLEVEMGAQI